MVNVPAPDTTFALQYKPPVAFILSGPTDETVCAELPNNPNVTSAKALILKEVFTTIGAVVIFCALPLPLPFEATRLE